MNLILRVATRWQIKAGLVEPPPKTVKEIADWAVSYVAVAYAQAAKDYYAAAKRHPGVDKFARNVQRLIRMGEDALDQKNLEAAMGYAHKAWDALNQPLPDRASRPILQTWIEDRAAKPYAHLDTQKFRDKPPDKKEKNLRWVLNGILNALSLFLMDTNLYQNQEGWELDLRDQEALFRLYVRQPVSRAEQRFKIDPSGWKYADLPGMDVFTRRWLVPIKISAASYGKVTAAWDSQRGSMILEFPEYGIIEKNRKAIEKVFTDLEDVVFHECIHMTQYLFGLLGFKGGRPSRKESPYKQYWGRYEDEYNQEEAERQIRHRLRSEGIDPKEVDFHSLDDVEFYSNLADAIREFKRKYRLDGDLNPLVTAFVRDNKFFKALKRVPDQQKKLRKAIKLLWLSLQTS